MSDFGRNHVFSGLKEEHFQHLSRADRMNLRKLIGRISESSFRRGFHHGCVMKDECPERITKNLFAWRHASLNKSIGPDGFPGGTSLDRLDVEYPMKDVGLGNGDAPKGKASVWDEIEETTNGHEGNRSPD